MMWGWEENSGHLFQHRISGYGLTFIFLPVVFFPKEKIIIPVKKMIYVWESPPVPHPDLITVWWDTYCIITAMPPVLCICIIYCFETGIIYHWFCHYFTLYPTNSMPWTKYKRRVSTKEGWKQLELNRWGQVTWVPGWHKALKRRSDAARKS